MTLEISPHRGGGFRSRPRPRPRPIVSRGRVYGGWYGPSVLYAEPLVELEPVPEEWRVVATFFKPGAKPKLRITFQGSSANDALEQSRKGIEQILKERPSLRVQDSRLQRLSNGLWRTV